MLKSSILICVCLFVIQSINGLTTEPHGYKVEELNVTTRDGVDLHTVIVFPHDMKKNGGKYPVIMDRSPYGYFDLEVIADIFLPFGFVTVGQDLRGTARSFGNFSMFLSDKNDSVDLGNWLVQQEWSNGKIYTFGASADGIASFQTIFDNPSWLAGQYIAWAPARLYQILFPFGTYKQETTENWLLGISMPDPSVVYDNIETVHENEAHTGEMWSEIEMSPATYANVRFPSAFWAGWYDLFSTETLAAYEGYNTMSDASVRYTSLLTVDPLGHCQDASIYFPQGAVDGRTALVFAQAFQVYGISPVHRNSIKNVTFYVMSSNDTAGLDVGQYWTSMESWPQPVMTKMYLHSEGSLTLTPPNVVESETSYQYDPSNPQYTNGGNNLPPDIGGDIPCGPLDQGAIDERSDVLVFQTSPLDSELPLTGPLYATLYVSSSAIDTDFMVRVSDVYPTGQVRLLIDNAVRMRWREGGSSPVYMESGVIYEVNMNLWNTSYVFAPGHKMRIAVSSSNNPRFSVNPNNGILLADPSYPGQNITAVNTIYHSARYPSHITLPVVNKLQLPKVNVLKEVQLAYPSLITKDTLPRLTKMLSDLATKRDKKLVDIGK